MDPALVTLITRRRAVLETLRDILVVDVLLDRRPEDIDPDTPLFATGLGLDSIDTVELMVSIEVQLGVRLEIDRSRPALALRNLDSLADAVIEAQDRSAP